MNNIFINLKQKPALKQESLQKLLTIDENQQQANSIVSSYFEQQSHTDQQNANFILKLIFNYSQNEIKQKLFAMLVYYIARIQQSKAKEMIKEIYNSSQSIFNRVRFYSLFYKSTTNQQVKKLLIINSINLIQQQTKISMFSNFVEHFDTLINNLTFQGNQYVEIYIKLINYLQKHLIYKKLWKHFIIQCLLKVTANNAQSSQVDSLFVKLLKFNEITSQSYALINHNSQIRSNKFYPFAQILLLGDYERFTQINKDILNGREINLQDLQRKIKIQAIPRILNGIKIASYSQISQILKINKTDVQSYIIEAIQFGLLKAKIDEYQQTILINSLRFATIRPEESAILQKNISVLAQKLQKLATQ